VIVLDTATWIWRASEPKRLSRAAKRSIEAADALLLSAISVWEVAMLVSKRRIALDRSLEAWIDAALALPGIDLVQLEPRISIRSTLLPGAFHPDPADRIIVATALERSAEIVTPDERIRDYPHVQSIW
jgi:PIN domain nuclease of toxin-antitoxin system